MDDHAPGLKQAQVLLELFEQDCGRAAVTLEEVSQWARAQDRGHLQLRMQRHLLGLLVGDPDRGEPQRPAPSPVFRRPSRGWRALHRRRADVLGILRRKHAGSPAA